MKKVLIALLFGVTFITSCIPMGSSDGVVWEYYPEESGTVITSGVELSDNNLFFGDDSGTIYSVGIDTGTLRWKRTLSNESVICMFADNSGLYVVSKSNYVYDSSIIRKYSLSEGLLDSASVTNLSILPLKNYSVFENSESKYLLLHSSNQIHAVRLTNRNLDESLSEIEIKDLSLEYSDPAYIATVIVNTNNISPGIFCIGSKGKNFKFDNVTFSSSVQFDFLDAGDCMGSAIFYNSKIYIGYSDGVRVMDTSSMIEDTFLSLDNVGVRYTAMFVDEWDSSIYLADTVNTGITRRNLGTMNQDWFYSTISTCNNSYFVVSTEQSRLAVLDDAGTVHIIDKTQGTLIYEKFFGYQDEHFMNIKTDYATKILFIPLNERIVAFNISYTP